MQYWLHASRCKCLVIREGVHMCKQAVIRIGVSTYANVYVIKKGDNT